MPWLDDEMIVTLLMLLFVVIGGWMLAERKTLISSSCYTRAIRYWVVACVVLTMLALATFIKSV